MEGENQALAKQSSNSEKARGIIEDTFRRADKNDDGSLSLEEFRTYFADGILSKEQLEEMFHQIDTHKTNNLDVGELCEYFSKFWGPFEEIFATLDDLSSSVTAAIHQTADHYDKKTFIEQFATRFLLKETLNHMTALEKPLEHVIDKLEEEAAENRTNEHGSVPARPPVTDNDNKTAKPRWQQRLDRSLSGQSDNAYIGPLVSEVSRLSQLIDKLECKVSMEIVEEEEVPEGKQNTVLLVSYNIECIEDGNSKFQDPLKSYVEGVRKQPGCYHVNVRRFSGTNRFMIYEVWQNEDSLQSHYASIINKTFRESCSELLEKPLEVKRFEIPESWWPSV